MSGSDDALLREKQYLLSCERGDLGSVRMLLEAGKNSEQAFNINCVDPLGRTALLIAIENENIEMIEVLLDYNIETGDAILYAIGEENVEAVEIIINHLDRLDKFNTETQGVEINEHSAFTPDITPIILAAHKDNYECIKLLLDRGASIPHPHDVRCACKECLQAKAEDSLRLSRSRINAYRALASPSLVCLSTKDPILYAFELSYELRRLSYIENEFRSEYQELSQRCQKFSVNMLDQVRGSKELEIILNHDTSDRWPVGDRAAPSSAADRMQLARLKLAVQYRQKRFVAHPNCQQLLAAIWYEGLPGFRSRNAVFKVLLILAVSISFPLLSIMYILAPKSFFSNFARKPFVKFLCHSASYCFFLFLLILASQRINYDHWFGQSINYTFDSGGGVETEVHMDPDRKERRGPPPTPVEWAILAWVTGLIWVEIKQLWDCGLHEYCYNLWNILDFITNALYLCTFALRTVAYIQAEAELLDPRVAHIARKLPRRDWDAWDPTLISECVFATANIFSSLKLVHIFTVNPHLGPLQISLGASMLNVFKSFAFACGLNQLFWYYASMRQQECQQYRELIETHSDLTPSRELRNLEESCDPKYRSCASLFNTVETLFWAMFGLIDLDHFNLKEMHYVTEWAGKTMFGTYGYISIIVLLNMLIAMMSNSYQYISNQADIEWKFARSKLWIEYFDDTATLPPPFNMIPSPKSFYYAMRWLCDRYCKCSRRIQQGKQRSMRLQRILKAVSQREANFQFVTRNLVKRYIAHVQRLKQNAEGVSEDDVNEIKQDISAFRYELLGILRNAGFSTGHADISQKTHSRNKKRSAMAERRLMKGLPDAFNIPPIPESFLPKEKPNDSSGTDSGRPSPARVTRFGPKVTTSTQSLNTWSRLKKLSKKVNFKHPPISSIAAQQHTGQLKRTGTKGGNSSTAGSFPSLSKSTSLEIEREGDSKAPPMYTVRRDSCVPFATSTYASGISPSVHERTQYRSQPVLRHDSKESDIVRREELLKRMGSGDSSNASFESRPSVHFGGVEAVEPNAEDTLL
uniref:Transient receptor ion channel domain-containing protein n=1 Tax=Plectus sambesii TaxID=2011161 RepID=A0A914VMF5_9BILA